MASKVDLGRSSGGFGLLLLAVPLGLGGCSEPEDTGGTLTQTQAQDFEGLYTLTARTLNSSACEVGQDSLATTTDTSLVLVAASFAGQQLVELVSCKPDMCADTVAKTKAQTIVGSEYRYSFTNAGGSNVLTGATSWSGRDNGAGGCTERSFDEFTLTRNGDTLRVERTTRALPDAPAEDGFCFAELAQGKKEAAGAACTEMETLDAKWSADLP